MSDDQSGPEAREADRALLERGSDADAEIAILDDYPTLQNRPNRPTVRKELRGPHRLAQTLQIGLFVVWPVLALFSNKLDPELRGLSIALQGLHARPLWLRDSTDPPSC